MAMASTAGADFFFAEPFYYGCFYAMHLLPAGLVYVSAGVRALLGRRRGFREYDGAKQDQAAVAVLQCAVHAGVLLAALGVHEAALRGAGTAFVQDHENRTAVALAAVLVGFHQFELLYAGGAWQKWLQQLALVLLAALSFCAPRAEAQELLLLLTPYLFRPTDGLAAAARLLSRSAALAALQLALAVQAASLVAAGWLAAAHLPARAPHAVLLVALLAPAQELQLRSVLAALNALRCALRPAAAVPLMRSATAPAKRSGFANPEIDVPEGGGLRLPLLPKRRPQSMPALEEESVAVPGEVVPATPGSTKVMGMVQMRKGRDYTLSRATQTDDTRIQWVGPLCASAESVLVDDARLASGEAESTPSARLASRFDDWGSFGGETM